MTDLRRGKGGEHTRAFVVLLALILANTVAEAATPPVSAPAVPAGQFMTGRRLAEICHGRVGNYLPDTAAGGTCLGYINGVAELMLLYGFVCYNNLSRLEITDAVVEYMKTHPDEVSRLTAVVLAGNALKSIYPASESCHPQTGASVHP
jgi:hypothetical protein